jgi:hypothetical protein
MFPFDLDAKLYAVGGGIVFIIAVSFYAGYSFKESDPSVICRPHIERISEMSVQIVEIEKGVAESRAVYIKEAAAREDAMCAAKIAEMRDSYKRLRCRICQEN